MFKRFSWTPASTNRNNMTLLYEPLQPYIFVAGIKQLGLSDIFDIGANIGQYSIFASALPCVERVHSFEVEQDAFANLVENVKLNDMAAKIAPRFVAVSDSNGEAEFGVAGPMAGNNALVKTSIHDAKVFKERRSVPTVALDSEFDFSNRKLAFKIDVEGHEAAVIAGGKNLLANNICLVQVEIYKGQEPVIQILEGMGYRKIFRAGPDHYFSNHPELADPQKTITMLEEASQALITYNLRG